MLTHRHDQPRRRAAAVAAVLVIAAFAVPATGGASPIDNQRNKVAALTDELEALEERSDVLAEDYLAATVKLTDLEAEVAAGEQRVADKASAVEALRGELAAMAVRTFTGSGPEPLSPLFVDLSETTAALQREQLARVARNTGTATTDELDAAVAELEDERDALAAGRDDVAEQIDQLADARAANDAQKAEYHQARAEAEAKLGDLIHQEEERRARESFERLQTQAAAAQAASEQASARQAGNLQQAAPQSQPARAASEAQRSPATRAAAAPSTPDPPAQPSIPPASSRAGTAINAAMTQLGVPWVFAMATPGVGFDCSGLTSWAWAQAGVSLPHQSRMQFDTLPHVPIEAAEPGDLIFYYSPISHVGIYLGGGKLVHAPNSGSVVNVATVNWSKVAGVGRPG